MTIHPRDPWQHGKREHFLKRWAMICWGCQAIYWIYEKCKVIINWWLNILSSKCSNIVVCKNSTRHHKKMHLVIFCSLQGSRATCREGRPVIYIDICQGWSDIIVAQGIYKQIYWCKVNSKPFLYHQLSALPRCLCSSPFHSAVVSLATCNIKHIISNLNLQVLIIVGKQHLSCNKTLILLTGCPNQIRQFSGRSHGSWLLLHTIMQGSLS